MRFLLTNDDGWSAPGLQLLAEFAGRHGEVWIVAPDGPMSGISHQITFEQPLKLTEQRSQVFSLSGTPADCVRIATTQLGVEFDWVLSGINNGANLGTDIFVSGTVAATREAAIHGCRSIALSQYRRQFKLNFDWTNTKALVERTLPQFFEQTQEHAPGTALNINFPDHYHRPADSTPSNGDVQLIHCEVDRHPLPADYRRDESGHFVYCSRYDERPRSPGSDIETCFSGHVAISKLPFGSH
jgi:5'-nucleotidase